MSVLMRYHSESVFDEKQDSMISTDPADKYNVHCGVTGCPNEVVTDCYYCGIPLCKDHCKTIKSEGIEETYCSACFLYISSSGLKENPLARRLVPNLLNVNSKKCTGCRTCQLICSFEHFGVFSYEKSAIDLKKNEEYGTTEIAVCRQCADPACVRTCPTGALQKDNQYGYVSLSTELCNNCLRCVKACPYGAIRVDEDRQIVKCDLCGGDPQCARYCPGQALQWVKKHSVGERHKLVNVVPTTNTKV